MYYLHHRRRLLWRRRILLDYKITVDAKYFFINDNPFSLHKYYRSSVEQDQTAIFVALIISQQQIRTLKQETITKVWEKWEIGIGMTLSGSTHSSAPLHFV